MSVYFIAAYTTYIDLFFLCALLSNNTEFYVDGKSLPEVDFDAGPSWAGLLPISGNANETRKVSDCYNI